MSYIPYNNQDSDVTRGRDNSTDIDTDEDIMEIYQHGISNTTLSPLYTYIREDNVALFKQQIDSGRISIDVLCNNMFVDPTRRYVTEADISNNTEYIILYAVYYYAVNVIKWLLDESADRESIMLDMICNDEGNTPLMLAIQMLAHGDKRMDIDLVAMIKSFVLHPQCSVNCINNNDWSPLCELVANDELQVITANTTNNTFNDVMNILLNAGANPTYNIPITNMSNLSVAMSENHVVSSLIHFTCLDCGMAPSCFIEYLDATCKYINARNKSDGCKYRNIVDYINLYDSKNQTPLAMTLTAGNHQMTSILIIVGCVLDISNTSLAIADDNTVGQIQCKISQLPVNAPMRQLYNYCSHWYDKISYCKSLTKPSIDITTIDPATILQFLDDCFPSMGYYWDKYAVLQLIQKLPSVESRDKYNNLYMRMMALHSLFKIYPSVDSKRSVAIMETVFKTHMGEDKEIECCVCYCNYLDRQLIVVKCPGKHWVCAHCLVMIVDTSNSCPMCRHQF